MDARRSGTRNVPRAAREALILDAAIAEFGVGSWHGTSVASVAARAGVSKALVLTYFGSKDVLYCRAVAAVATPMLCRVTAAVEQSAPGWPMALATIEAIATSVEPRPRDWLLVDDSVHIANEAAARELAEIQLQFRALSMQGIGSLLHSGAGPFDSHDADLLCGLWESAVSSAMSWWIANPDEPIDSLLARCARLIETLSTD